VTADTGSDVKEPPETPRLAVIFGALVLGMLLGALDVNIVSTALPTITIELGGLEYISWVVTAYLLASTATTPLWGKLGDQFGRKRVYQLNIVLFLLGSVLCGMAQNMGQLIAFRAIQGLAGGGLMVIAMAIIGDVVPPRDRGRYQGIFGAVFGVSSVIGPLLGGFLTESLSWRWVFYVNLPVGAIALIATVVALPSTRVSSRPRIDYLGTVLIASATSCFVLVLSLGGTAWAWTSPEALGTTMLGVVLTVAFCFAEARAAEPILPLRLFRNRTFTLASAIGLIVGMAMFGAVTYIPVFQQVVYGDSPTESGLHLLPLMAGMLLTANVSGQLISRTGRYKPYPLAGTVVLTVGLLLLSTLQPQTSRWLAGLYLFVFGAGLGFVMQVLVVIVQNAVEYENLGVATSGVVFFRNIGASIGTAAFGTLFVNHLSGLLDRQIAGAPPGFDPSVAASDPSVLARLPAEVVRAVTEAYADSIGFVFLLSVPVVVVGFVLALFLTDRPLRTTARAAGVGDGFGVPRAASSIEEIERALGVLVNREQRRRVYERVVERAGLDLDPRLAILLVNVHQRQPVSARHLAHALHLVPEKIAWATGELASAGFVTPGADNIRVTPAGDAVVDRLVAARREMLGELLDGFTDAQRAGLAAMLNRLAGSLLDREREAHPLART
jgi:EmrB/QacA subfamily drug resistance transporter